MKQACIFNLVLAILITIISLSDGNLIAALGWGSAALGWYCVIAIKK